MLTGADKITLLLALGLLVGLYSQFWGSAGPADTVVIAVSGQPELTAPLSEDRQVVVHGALGDSIIEINQGRARFLASPCRGKQCIHSGWLRQGGEVAACLPNGVTLTVASATQRYDAINF